VEKVRFLLSLSDVRSGKPGAAHRFRVTLYQVIAGELSLTRNP
jgi:hypothetical protein